MRMSATGPRINSRGFTLIEVMVVLVIVAVLAGLLVIGFTDSPQQRLRKEARDLATLINAAADEAVMRSMELGLVVDGSGYQFVVFDLEKKQWQAAPERAFARHKFTDGYAIDFAIDGTQVDDQTRQRIQAFAERSGDAAMRPSLLILSSGEVTPFRLTLSADKLQPVALAGDGLNPVVIADSDKSSSNATAAPANVQD
ncbi:MAG: type secretion system protein GspH [Verrucomicrobiaceae bacterium]|nr:type secretion system protein GspH [Verrucomicrobiaceae bacterium]